MRSAPLRALSFGALFLLVFSAAEAQNNWSVVPGSKGFQAYDLLAHEGMILGAGHNGTGILRVKEDGTGYQVIAEPFSHDAIYRLAAVGNSVYAGTTGGLFRSEDNGATWTLLPQVRGLDYILDVAGNDSLLFAATAHGVSVSRDRGATWAAALTTELQQGSASLLLHGSHVFATWENTWVQHSSDNGKTWDSLTYPGQYPDRGLRILALGDRLFVSGRKKLNISPDLGKTWLPTAGKDTLLNTEIFLNGFLSYSQGLLYAQRGDAPYRVTRVSADSGATWSQVDLGYGVEDALLSGTNLFAAGWRDNSPALYMASTLPGAVRPVLGRTGRNASQARPVFQGSGMVVPWRGTNSPGAMPAGPVLFDSRGRTLRIPEAIR